MMSEFSMQNFGLIQGWVGYKVCPRGFAHFCILSIQNLTRLVGHVVEYQR